MEKVRVIVKSSGKYYSLDITDRYSEKEDKKISELEKSSQCLLNGRKTLTKKKKVVCKGSL